MKMDANILRNIVSSSSAVSIKIESSKEWQSVGDDEDFPVTKSTLIDGLSKTLTKLLLYKVSQEAYQRYSVRLNVIETLRDWSRVKGDMGKLSIFQDSEQSYSILIHILKKYLTYKILSNCDNTDSLVQLAEILFNAVIKNKAMMKYFVRVIERIICLDQTEKSEKFLEYIIKESDNLKLDSTLVEKIYTSQKSQLIEKPFTDWFIAYCSDQTKQEPLRRMDFLFENMIDSPSLFQLVANQLKEMFVMTKYAQTAQDFIQNILNKIQTHCNAYNKDTLDLYPKSLQFCVILLRIKPSYHTEHSKKQTVLSLKEILLKDYNDALILISHFPDWLPEYLEFFENLEGLTEKSEVQSINETSDQC